jgi:hypothetical protein
MLKIAKFLTLAVFVQMLTSFATPAKSEYDIEAFYNGILPANGTKVLTSGEGIKDVDMILTPLEIPTGNYVVNVTRKGSDLYKVDGKNIYIKTRYCYEYSYGDEIILKVEGNYGYSKGKVVFTK